MIPVVEERVRKEEKDSFGNRLQTLREVWGMSRRELAQRAKVLVSRIGNLEKGRANPSVETLQRRNNFPREV